MPREADPRQRRNAHWRPPIPTQYADGLDECSRLELSLGDNDREEWPNLFLVQRDIRPGCPGQRPAARAALVWTEPAQVPVRVEVGDRDRFGPAADIPVPMLILHDPLVPARALAVLRLADNPSTLELPVRLPLLRLLA